MSIDDLTDILVERKTTWAYCIREQSLGLLILSIFIHCSRTFLFLLKLLSSIILTNTYTPEIPVPY